MLSSIAAQISAISSKIGNLDSLINSQEEKISSQLENKFSSLLDNAEKKINSKLGTDSTEKKATANLGFENFFPKIKAEPKSEAPKIKVDDFSKLPEGFNNYIEQVAKEEGVESSLIKSLIKQESNFDPQAKSQAGARGLTQLMPATAKEMGVFNLENPYQNLRGGVKYLSKMLKKYNGDIRLSLAAYNAGPSNVDKYKGVPPFKETQNYVQNIMKDYLKRNNYKPIDVVA